MCIAGKHSPFPHDKHGKIVSMFIREAVISSIQSYKELANANSCIDNPVKCIIMYMYNKYIQVQRRWPCANTDQ